MAQAEYGFCWQFESIEVELMSELGNFCIPPAAHKAYLYYAGGD